CTASCDAKAECDPDNWGSAYVNASTCPLNVCCSSYGFCGTTSEFCGDTTVTRPSCDASSQNVSRIIGYYEAYAMSSRACDVLRPTEIPYGVYTHVNFAFGTIDPTTFAVQATDETEATLLQEIGSLKLIQPNLQIWLSLGGWSFSDADESTHYTFSNLAASEADQKAFFASLISFMGTYGFDGVDIDWEYPVEADRGGRSDDYDNFPSFLKSMQSSFSGTGSDKGISITLPSSYYYMQHFDIVSLSKYVDWFNIMAYDLHGTWDEDSSWTGPYINAHTNMTELQTTLDLLWRNDIDSSKVVLGMAYYGRSFTLTEASCSEPGCRFVSGGNAGNCSITAGVLLNPEIMNIISANGLAPTLYKDAAVKAINWENQWVSYDDEDTWKLKSEWLKGQCISGVMVWAATQDDTNGTWSKALMSGLGVEIMQPVKIQSLSDLETTTTTTTRDTLSQCRWTNCGDECPSGFKEVPRDGTKLTMTDTTGCSPSREHKFCCPASDTDFPTCRWRGFHNTGFCTAGCKDGETEVGSLSEGCRTSHQSACCTVTSSTKAYSKCKWVGSSPPCASPGKNHTCPDDYPHFLFADSNGAGGEQTCSSGRKSYCCTEIPDEFTDCKWYNKETTVIGPESYYCETSCPTNYIRLGMEAGSCGYNMQAYCCGGKTTTTTTTTTPNDPYASWIGWQYAEFVTLLRGYMENPYCFDEELSVPGMDYFYSEEDGTINKKKREIILGRTCSSAQWQELIKWVGLLFSSSTSDFAVAALRQVWDEEFAGYYSTTLQYATLAPFLATFASAGQDITAWLTDMLRDPISAAADIEEVELAMNELCTLDDDDGASSEGSSGSSTSTKRSLHGELLLPRLEGSKRHINGIVKSPGMKSILEAVNAGTLPLNYARWLEYQARNARDNPYIVPGVILELAYWIGPEVGTVGDSTYDQYRDMTDGTGADQWVIFHLHFDERGVDSNVHPFVSITEGGATATYSRTASIRVYHGRYTVTAGNNLRVQYDSGSSTSRSSAFYCSGNAHWDIGRTSLTPTARTWGAELQTWGTNLRETYLDSDAWRLVYPDLSTTNNEIDADWITAINPPSVYTADSWIIGPDGLTTDVYIPAIPPP
ncbi:glycoside hydrolase, partial [Aspergillus brunneoviolaceus CBS 621.78]